MRDMDVKNTMILHRNGRGPRPKHPHAVINITAARGSGSGVNRDSPHRANRKLYRKIGSRPRKPRKQIKTYIFYFFKRVWGSGTHSIASAIKFRAESWYSCVPISHMSPNHAFVDDFVNVSHILHVCCICFCMFVRL